MDPPRLPTGVSANLNADERQASLSPADGPDGLPLMFVPYPLLPDYPTSRYFTYNSLGEVLPPAPPGEPLLKLARQALLGE